MFSFLIASNPSHTLPHFLPFTLHGSLSSVDSLTKTLFLVDVLKARNQLSLVEDAYRDLLPGTRLSMVFNTKVLST